MTVQKTYPYLGSQGTVRICPLCPGLKLSSTVTRAGAETKTTNALAPVGVDSWDINGAYIVPPTTNTVTATFSCSQGHKWTEQGPCY